MGRNHLSIDAREEDANWVLGKMHPHYLLPSSPRCYPGTSVQARAVCDRAPVSLALVLWLCLVLSLVAVFLFAALALPVPDACRGGWPCAADVLSWFGLPRLARVFTGRGVSAAEAPVGSGSSRLVSRCGAGLCSFDCSCDFEFDALRFDGRASSSFSPLSSASSRCRLSGCSSSRTNGGVANRSIRNGCGL